uniref:ATP-dependent DNA helicase RecQ zinc-binding domain-containing protein n=1 Tax=Arundo donax TaxID=35708 RepID=A0A0A9CP67_ARUDO
MQDSDATLYSPLIMQIVDYCESSSCRQKRIIESFGEKVQPTLCQHSCDACKHPNLVSSRLEELRCKNTWTQSSGIVKMRQAYQLKTYQILMLLMADGKEVVSNIAISKIGPKAGLDAQFKALERAESAYYQAKQQGGSLVDKKNISQALRDACRKRLLDTLGQAKLRLGNLL